MAGLPWGDLAYDAKTPAEVVHEYVMVRGDLSEQYARDQLASWIERYAAAQIAARGPGPEVVEMRAARLEVAQAMAAGIDFDDEDRELGPNETLIMLRVVGPGAEDASLEDEVEHFLHERGWVVVND